MTHLHRSRKDAPLINAGSNQYNRVTPGDVIWFVTIKKERLLLIGRIEVAEVIQREEAKRRFADAWDAEYHVVARQGSETKFREFDLTGISSQLRFEGGVSMLPPNFGQSFQTMRRLSSESIRLFERVWAGLDISQLVSVRQLDLTPSDEFDPKDERDARIRIAAQIVSRQGQSQFRSKLLAAYEGRCAVTGCEVEGVLEAAHIIPFRGEHTNSVANGLLLRSDVHTLFDLRLLTVHPNQMTVRLASFLRAGHYGSFHGCKLRLPAEIRLHPNHDAIRSHFEESGITE